jgi:hypothetical protein
MRQTVAYQLETMGWVFGENMHGTDMQAPKSICSVADVDNGRKTLAPLRKFSAREQNISKASNMHSII